MSFFWGKSSSKSETDRSKARHIADLAACFPSIRRPNNDDSSFELAFEADRKLNTLRIWLPSDFPSNKPVLQVLGPVQHPWLDQYKRVSGCDKVSLLSSHIHPGCYSHTGDGDGDCDVIA
jgi:hypothetical protein